MAITIALDCMGGDHGAHVTVPAALDFVDGVEDAQVVLVGIPKAIETELKHRRAKAGGRIRIEAAAEVVAMDEAPASALRDRSAAAPMARVLTPSFCASPTARSPPRRRTSGPEHSSGTAPARSGSTCWASARRSACTR